MIISDSQRGLTWNSTPLPLHNPLLWKPRCLWSFHCLPGGASPVWSALNMRPHRQTHIGHDCNVPRLENKHETQCKIYITRSIHMCLDFEAAVVYLGGWFILDIFIDFFTFHFNIKPEKNKIFFHKLNSFHYNENIMKYINTVVLFECRQTDSLVPFSIITWQRMF